MTQQELAGQLGRLDPGAVLTMDESALAKAFDARSIDYETLSKIEELAMKYGCSFSCHDRGRVLPMSRRTTSSEGPAVRASRRAVSAVLSTVLAGGACL